MSPQADISAPRDPARGHDRATADVRVLYIAGKGRSGSTLLCRTLGDIDGFFAAGELMRIFGRGVTNDDLCGCGDPVTECDVWSGVLDHLEANGPDFDPHRMRQLRDWLTEGPGLLTYYLAPWRSRRLARRLTRYRSILTSLYRAIREVTGAEVVVDSSKNGSYLRVLTETPGLRLDVVHLIRDSRGVTQSLSRKKAMPGTRGRTEFFDQRGVVTGSLLWSGAQLMAERTAARAATYTRVRYEDFVRRPEATVRQILELLDRADGDEALRHVEGRTLEFGKRHHVIASNPNRSETGPVELREDTAWRSGMGTLRKGVVTALTYPLLRRYGYLSEG